MKDLNGLTDRCKLRAGLAYISEWSVAEDLEVGRLIQVLDDWTPPYSGLSLCYPGRRHQPVKVRAFIELIWESWTLDVEDS